MVMVMIMVLIMIMIVIMMMIMPRQLLHDFVLDDQEYVDGLGLPPSGRWPTHPRDNLRAWPSPSPTSTENGVFIAFVNRAMTWQTLPMQIAESAAIAVVS